MPSWHVKEDTGERITLALLCPKWIGGKVAIEYGEGISSDTLGSCSYTGLFYFEESCPKHHML